MIREKAGDLVSRCATLAALLEVSAYPKPGNVHRIQNIPGTTYEHFLAGSIAIEPMIRRLAFSGYDSLRYGTAWKDIRLGSNILEGVKEMLSWQSGGNVNLGVILLFAPLSVAAGSALYGEEQIDVYNLREVSKKVIRATTSKDTVAVYEAIRLAVPLRVLGQVEEFDVSDESAAKQIKNEGLTLFEIFKRCENRDSICQEWTSNFETTYTLGYPYLKNNVEKIGINSAIVDTFLVLLSKKPDTLIQRKSGFKKAIEVSEKAQLILKKGGSASSQGRKLLWALDRELQSEEGRLNPGTTADLTAASIFILLLEGWRP